jgi:hypothetical protein
MLTTRLICNICNTEGCEGKEYRVQGEYSYYGEHTLNKIACSSMINSDTLKYDLVCGHGAVFTFDAVHVVDAAQEVEA